jgi:endonuclease/exonuclease/phosphatase family metal-dependent hydrolase
MFRNSERVTFTPTSWLSDDQWLTPEGTQLSDHEPIHVTLDWAVN